MSRKRKAEVEYMRTGLKIRDHIPFLSRVNPSTMESEEEPVGMNNRPTLTRTNVGIRIRRAGDEEWHPSEARASGEPKIHGRATRAPRAPSGSAADGLFAPKGSDGHAKWR